MKRLIFTLLGLYFSLSSSFGQASSEQSISDLDSLLIYAGENSPKLKSAWFRYLAAVEVAPQVGALPDPSIMFRYFLSPVETRVGAQRFGIDLQQSFPWFGTLKAREKQAGFQAEAERMQFVDEKFLLFHQIRKAYYNVALVQLSAQILRSQLQIFDEIRVQIERRIASGKAKQSDLIRLDIQRADLSEDLLHLMHQERRLDQALRSAANLPYNMNIRANLPDHIQPLADKEIRLKNVLDHNPEIQRLIYAKDAAWEQVGLAQKQSLPSFNLGISYTNVESRNVAGISDNGQDILIFPNLGLSVPLFRNKYKALQQEARLRNQAANSDLEVTRLQLLSDFTDAWEDQVHAYHRLVHFNEQIQRSEQLLSYRIAEYASGQSDLQDLLEAQRLSLQFELDKKRAMVRWFTAHSYLDYLSQS